MMLMKLLAAVWVLAVFVAVPAAAQTVAVMPNAMTQFVDGNGAPYAGGKVFMYVPLTTTPKATYQDPLAHTPNSNPITLDANGRAIIWGNGEYRQVLEDVNSVVVWDQLTAATPTTSGSSGQIIWYGTATGTANAITLATPAGFTGVDGQIVGFIASSTNTTSATINASGFGTVLVEKSTSTGPTVLTGAEIVAGNLTYATYSKSANEFILLAYPLLLGFGTTPQVTFAADGVHITPNLTVTGNITAGGDIVSGGEVDGANIGDTTYVTPKYCPYATLTVTTDQTVCIQAAITAACAFGKGGNIAGKLVFARAIYYIRTGNILIPATCPGLILEGQGDEGGGGNSTHSSTWILSDNNCTGPLFKWYTDATQNYIYGGGVRDMSFYNSPLLGDRFGTQSCKFPLLKAQFGTQMVFEHIYSWLPYQFIQLISGNQLKIKDLLMDQVLQDSPGAIECFGYGAHADATGQQTRQDGCTLEDIFAGGAPFQGGHQIPVGIYWHGFSASPRLHKVAFENFKNLILEDCTVPGGYIAPADQGACPAFFVCYDCEVEGAGGNLIDMKDVQSVSFYFLYAHGFGPGGFGGGAGDGVFFRNGLFTQTAGLTIVGGEVDSMNHSGIEIEAAGSVIQGVHIFNNNLAATGGIDLGILTPVGGDHKNSHVIEGNQFCNDLAGNVFTDNAILLQPGTDYSVIVGNMFHGCTSGVTDSSGGAHNIIGNNSGL